MSVSSRNMLQKSSETIAGNIDILTEILLRLPSKPLGKFKSVSKQWLALISDPKFCHSHTLRHHTLHPLPTAILFDNDSPHFQLVPISDSVLRVPPLDYLNIPRVSIIQSCNGLLLCSYGFLETNREQIWKVLSSLDYCDSVVSDDGPKCFVCNPTTMQFATVTFPNKQFREQIISLNLAFDPLRSPHYKILSIRDHTKEKKFVINVYSSETCSWSDRDICFTPLPRMVHGAPVYFNGAILWYCVGENSVYFDVDTQCLKTLPMPKAIKYGYVEYFRECGGHCHMVVIENRMTLEFNILELKEDFSGWFVRYRVDLTPMKIAFPELYWRLEEEIHFSVLGVFQQSKEEESEVVMLVDGRAMSVNLATHASRKLCHLGAAALALDCGLCDAHLYFENLSCVNGFPAS